MIVKALKHHVNCKLDLMSIQYHLIFKELLDLIQLIGILILKLDFLNLNNPKHLRLFVDISLAFVFETLGQNSF